MKALIKYICMSLLALTVFSCTQSEDDPTQQVQKNKKEKVQVSFTVALDETTQSSRGADETWGDYNPTDEGNDWENYIDLDNLQVFLYDSSNNSYLGEVTGIIYSQTDENTYEFIGSAEMVVDEGTSAVNCKVMVFANCGDISSPLQVANLSYNFNGEMESIPMWGVQTATIQVRYAWQQDLGTIALLRSMAKIEVKLSDELTTNYTLNSVLLDRYHNNGYCLPSGYAGINATENLYLQGANQSFNPSDGEIVMETLAFNPSDAGNQFCIYVPEFDNDNTVEDGTAQMILTINGSNYHLKLQDYTSGIPAELDIVRNHYYLYRITSISGDEIELTLEYQVQEWEDIVNPNIEFN